MQPKRRQKLKGSSADNMESHKAHDDSKQPKKRGRRPYKKRAENVQTKDKEAMREAKKRNKSCKSNESILKCKQREVQPKQNNSHINNSASGPIKIKIENVQIGA